MAAAIFAPRLLGALVTACAAAAAGAMPPAPSGGPWVHDMSSVSAMQWADFGHSHVYDVNFTATDVAFVANNYQIVSLEKCFALGNFSTTEEAFVFIASAMRATSPNLHILFYYHIELEISSCYNASHTFLNHSSWWLRDDNGNVYNTSQGWYTHDPTVPAVVDWYASVPLTLPNGAFAAGLVDGVFADGTSPGAPFPNMSAARNLEVVAAYSAMANATSARLNAARPGAGVQVIGNGVHMYDFPPDHGMGSLPFVDGVCFEHFGAFEMIGVNGSMIPSEMATLIGYAQQAAADNRTVLIKTWPGPVVGPLTPLGPSWPGGNQPTTRAGLGQAATAMMNGSLALFLLVVEPNVWLSYSWWYDSVDGYYPCPDNPERCSSPVNWYPDWSRPLGDALGPAARVAGGSGWAYARQFQHASVYVDLVDPWTTAVIQWS